MTNNKMVYLVKVSRDLDGNGYEQDIIVFATLDEDAAHDFVDEYGSAEFLEIEGYPLDKFGR